MGWAPVLAAGLQRWVPGSPAQVAAAAHTSIPLLQLLRFLCCAVLKQSRWNVACHAALLYKQRMGREVWALSTAHGGTGAFCD